LSNEKNSKTFCLFFRVFYYGFITSQVGFNFGFSAKVLLQGTLSISVQKTIEKGDNDINLIDLATNTIDERDNSTASVYGLRKAIGKVWEPCW
jgi:hypothetical protein